MNDTCTAGDLIYMGTGGARKGTGLTITTDTQILGRALESAAATATVIAMFVAPEMLHLAVGFTTTAVNAGGNNIVID